MTPLDPGRRATGRPRAPSRRARPGERPTTSRASTTSPPRTRPGSRRCRPRWTRSGPAAPRGPPRRSWSPTTPWGSTSWPPSTSPRPSRSCRRPSLAIDALGRARRGPRGPAGRGEPTLREALAQLRARLPRGVPRRRRGRPWPAPPEPDDAAGPTLLARPARTTPASWPPSSTRRPVPLPEPRRPPAPRAAAPTSRSRTGSAFDLVAAVDRPRARGRRSSRPSPPGGWWSGNLNVVTAAGHRGPDPLDAAGSHAGDGGRSPGSPATSAPSGPCTSGSTRRCSRTSVTGSPTARSSSTASTCRCGARTPARRPVTLLFVGLDRFQRARTTGFGRERRRRAAPRASAERLDGLRGPTDSVARWGDDEFVFLCEDGDRRATTRADRIADAFARPVPRRRASTCSSRRRSAPPPASPARSPPTSSSARPTPRARWPGSAAAARVQRFDDEMQDRARRRAEVEDALRGAADRGELVLHYQPEVSLRTNQHRGASRRSCAGSTPSGASWRPASSCRSPRRRTSSSRSAAGCCTTAMEQCGALAGPLRRPHARRSPSTSRPGSSRRTTSSSWWPARSSGPAPRPADLCLEITESVLMDDVDRTARHARAG